MLIPRRVKHRKQHHPDRTWCGQGRHRGDLRRVRHPGARAGLHHQPADRVRSYRHDPPHQAWRQGLDQHLPGPPADQEARRDPHGFRQGLAGVVDRHRQARPGACSSSPVSRRDVAREAMRRAQHKLPMKSRFVRARQVSLMASRCQGPRAARARRRRLVGRAARGQGGAVQPALPGGHRPAGEPRSAAHGEEGHRPHLHRDARARARHRDPARATRTRMKRA